MESFAGTSINALDADETRHHPLFPVTPQNHIKYKDKSKLTPKGYKKGPEAFKLYTWADGFVPPKADADGVVAVPASADDLHKNEVVPQELPQPDEETDGKSNWGLSVPQFQRRNLWRETWEHHFGINTNTKCRVRDGYCLNGVCRQIPNKPSSKKRKAEDPEDEDGSNGAGGPPKKIQKVETQTKAKGGAKKSVTGGKKGGKRATKA